MEFIKTMENSDLQKLTNALPILISCCITASSTRKYLRAYKHWKVWATTHNLTALLAHIALYLQHLAEDKGSKAAVEEGVNGLALVHGMSGDSSPIDSPIVQTILGGLKRKLAKPVNTVYCWNATT